jgi:hypothetical protein
MQLPASFEWSVPGPNWRPPLARPPSAYPRGAEAERQVHGEATEALLRAKTPEAAFAVVLRLLVAQRLADTDGLPNADSQDICERLAASKVLDKLAARVAPASVKRHLAEHEAERERREQAWRDEQAVKLQAQRAKLEAGRAHPLWVLPALDRDGRGRRREARRTRPRRNARVSGGSASDDADEAD